MKRRWSLTGRLVRRTAIIGTVGWLLALAAGLWSLSNELNEALDDGLVSRAQIGLALLESGQPVGAIPLGESDVLRLDGQDTPWPDGYGQSWSAGGWHVVRAQDARYRVEIGQPASYRREEFWEATGTFLLLMCPLLLLVLGTVYLTAKQALSPARELASLLSSRAPEDLSSVDGGDLPDELRPIPEALNGYLARIDTLLAAERAFAANAAHELRTPLATARVQAQALASDRPEAARLDRALTQLTQLVDRLLQLARAESGGIRRKEPVDLLRIVPLVLDENPGKVIFDDGDLTEMIVQTDPDLLAIMLRNLIANAVEHGTGQVTLRLAPGSLAIRNPVDPDTEFHVGRFRKSSDSVGAGLGLTIVHTIAETLGILVQMETDAVMATVRLEFTDSRDARTRP